MLTTPISITIDGTAHSLSRINNDNFGSTYLKKAAGLELRCNVRHSYESAKAGAVRYERHNVELTKTTWDVDGKATVVQSYAVIRTPQNVDPDVVADVTVGMNAFITSNIVALTTWES
jgi:hypothetical protein